MSDDDKRDTYIRRLCRVSVVVIILSCACIVVGGLSIAQSAPYFLFPYCLGGAMIAGLFVIPLAVCNIKLYCSYRENGDAHADEHTVKVWVCRQIVPAAFMGIALIVGIGVSGIWGMVKATYVINFEEKFNMTTKEDVPYAKANLQYAIASFVLVLILSIVQTVLTCVCLCYTDTYGFTDNAHYYWHHGIELRQRYRPPPPPRPMVIRVPAGSPSNHAEDSDDLRVINIPQSNYNYRPTPSAPSAARDFTDDMPSSRTVNSYNTSRHTPRNDNESVSDGQPPPYEHVSEDPPPSYNQVLKGGAFKVSYV